MLIKWGIIVCIILSHALLYYTQPRFSFIYFVINAYLRNFFLFLFFLLCHKSIHTYSQAYVADMLTYSQAQWYGNLFFKYC